MQRCMCLCLGEAWELLVLAFVVVPVGSGRGGGCSFNSVCTAKCVTAAATMGLHDESCWVPATGDKSLSLFMPTGSIEGPSRFLGSAQLNSKLGVDVIMWEVGI
jgi:hypothetical protein